MSALDGQIEERIFRAALLSRFVEEQLLKLFSEGKLSGTLHTCIGQEMVGAVLSEFLRPGDLLFSNHRGHGHYLSFVDDPESLIAELFGRESGVCGGLGGSQHLCDRGFYSNGIQGGIVPVATGLAFAKKLEGEGHISTVFIGDGTLGEGAVYEAFNLASRWSVPLLVVLEDNGIAQSTPQEQTFAGSVAARAEGFGLDYALADTWDWQGLFETAGRIVSDVRNRQRPALLHIRTYRLKAHSKGDDTRPRSEVEPFERKDPLSRYIDHPGNASVVARVRERVAAALAAAESSPQAVYHPPVAEPTSPLNWSKAEVHQERLGRALNRGFGELMKRHEDIIMLGEDIESPYGGAFKVTAGLSDGFPGRVRNTPISESAIVGMGTGLALMGKRPVVEIMFGDFLGLAFDQIVNGAAKFTRMYNGKVTVDLVVRTPMGGRRGYGPTHSQSLERHFLGTPGLRMLAINNLMDPLAVYGPLFCGHPGPTLVIENKVAYGTELRATVAPGFAVHLSSEQFPTAWLRPQAQDIDITLLGYGGMSEILVQAAERLFEEHDLIAQVLCPTLIHPFDVRPLLPAILNSKQLVAVEEGQGFAGFASEVFAQMAECAPAFCDRLHRIAPPPDVIPASASLERRMLPSLEEIIARIVAHRA